jgi:hypothetical protein
LGTRELTVYPLKQLRSRRDPHPSTRNGRFDTLQTPKMVEQLFVVDQSLAVQDRVEWRLDFVFERETIPTNFAVRILEDSRI